MPVLRLLREQTIGETRWAALGAGDVPLALYLERPHADVHRAVIGEQVAARVRKLDAGTGGAFVDLGAKGEAFLRLKANETAAEGAALQVKVAAEARRGKLARVRKAEPGAAAAGGAAQWRAMLKGAAEAPVEDRPVGDSEVAAAFADALLPQVTLPGGGRLQAERTEALVAVDIDTAGRNPAGGRAAAALAINLDAAETLARQIHLRNWGGLAVLDCVAPVDRAAGARVSAAFLAAFRDISGRAVKALAPSPFGLMEISADWQCTPLSERLLAEDGQSTAETLALAGLRALEAAARANRMARLELALPDAAFRWLAASGLDAETRLGQTYGARFAITPKAGARADVKVI